MNKKYLKSRAIFVKRGILWALPDSSVIIAHRGYLVHKINRSIIRSRCIFLNTMFQVEVFKLKFY